MTGQQINGGVIMDKIFSKAFWTGFWRRMLASRLWHSAMLCVGIMLALAIVFCVLYFYVFPRLSYRKLTNSVVSEGSIVSAVVTKGEETFELNDMQKLAIVSWLADYRSENNGIVHTTEREGSKLEITLSDGRRLKLNLEPSAIVFDGIMGPYRIKLDYNDIYNLIINPNQG